MIENIWHAFDVTARSSVKKVSARFTAALHCREFPERWRCFSNEKIRSDLRKRRLRLAAGDNWNEISRRRRQLRNGNRESSFCPLQPFTFWLGAEVENSGFKTRRLIQSLGSRR